MPRIMWMVSGFVFWMLCGLGVVSQANEEAGTATRLVDQKLVNELLAWIGANSEYDVAYLTETLPKIKFCDRGDRIDYEGKPITVHDELKGLYDKEAECIFLVKPWAVDDHEQTSVLLHELIHFVQYNSKGWTCWQKTEWEAYKLQEKWLYEHEIDPGFNWIEILLDSSCAPRDIHPPSRDLR